MNAPACPLTLLCAALLLVLFTLVASADGLYFHLYRYRLYQRPASRHEHRLHTANALLFPVQTYLLFCTRPEGAYLWLALFLFLATVAIETTDVLCEGRSRADLGGLTPVEYCMHFFMSGLRWGALVPLFLTNGAAAYAMAATGLHQRPLWFVLIGWSILVPGVAVAGLHVALDIVGKRRIRQSI